MSAGLRALYVDRVLCAGGDVPIVGRLNAETDGILQVPAVKERLDVLAFEYHPNTPQQFSDYVRKEVAKWGKAVKESGARADYLVPRTRAIIDRGGDVH